jgi:hypothetical protein
MRSVSNKSCKKINTHILCWLTSSRKSCLLWDNVGKCGGARGHRQYGTCTVILDKKSYTRVRKPAHPHPLTHTQKCVILIAFPRQQWFRERTSVSRYTHTASVVWLWRHYSSGIRYSVTDWHYQLLVLQRLCEQVSRNRPQRDSKKSVTAVLPSETLDPLHKLGSGQLCRERPITNVSVYTYFVVD